MNLNSTFRIHFNCSVVIFIELLNSFNELLNRLVYPPAGISTARQNRSQQNGEECELRDSHIACLSHKNSAIALYEVSKSKPKFEQIGLQL